ncbi:MarR family winged helix-turn-helix transcriptional regulator [Arthrobacter sp. ERGS1:01]|uniref:MarR family winged helix-turn-helix transcriptional regulator n=1 Tax=Arthrobacter sp. ERGS1:01 TaxID=1704044 RepID=UPI0006B5235E|nr:helix-turn-helix domain-containing protein [Arthrobacter sp. ERGS1:01]
MRGFELYRLARGLREVALATSADPGEYPVSAGELAVIEDVSRHPASPIKDIAQRTRLAQSLVSKTVALMREGGIFVTEADPNDGRKSLVSIDPQARMEVFAERGARTITATLAEALPTADPDTLARMEALLAEAYAIVQEHGRA